MTMNTHGTPGNVHDMVQLFDKVICDLIITLSCCRVHNVRMYNLPIVYLLLLVPMAAKKS